LRSIGRPPSERNEALQRFHAEAGDLDRQRVTHAEGRGDLRLVDDDDDAPTRLGDDLLAQQGPAAALDQVEGGG
jgi:hypothetical protein